MKIIDDDLMCFVAGLALGYFFFAEPKVPTPEPHTEAALGVARRAVEQAAGGAPCSEGCQRGLKWLTDRIAEDETKAREKRRAEAQLQALESQQN
jgi:hypothetical protein